VADRVATFAFTLDAAIEAVDVRVAKPSVLGADGLVSVRLHRRRP
jgi:dihydroneopterin aldolase